MNEQWKDVVGYEVLYYVSNLGNVSSVFKDRYLTASTDTYGYKVVTLFMDGKRKMKKVHRLVAIAFLGDNPEGKTLVCHNDGNPANNNVLNLRWDNDSGNGKDRVKHGTQVEATRTHCPLGHPLTGSNLESWSLKRGKRKCRSCSNARRYILDHPHMNFDLKTLSDTYFERYNK